MGEALAPLLQIVVVTGIQAAGKSTVARLLARRFERGYTSRPTSSTMIVSGRVLPQEPGVMPPEAERQLRLRLRNACLLARSFFDAGFTPVIDDIIIGERREHAKEDLAGLPFELIVLAPRPEVVAKQPDAGRRQARARRRMGGLPRPRAAGDDGWCWRLDRQQRPEAS